MQQMISKTLGGGIHLTILPNEKFKTSVMSACMVLPLGGARTSALAVLPRVLRRGTARYPDMQSIGALLDELYGARVEPLVRKRGESLVIGFLADVIDEKYAMGDVGLTERVADLLGMFWKEPYLEEGKFSADYTQGERENLADRIEALRNDPGSYALRRLHEEMCRGEVFGESELGTVQGARALTPEALSEAYTYVLENACLELFYCGSMPPAAVEKAFLKSFGTRDNAARPMPETKVIQRPEGEVRTVVEELNVQQGKLALGFRTGVTDADKAYPAMLLFTTAFGGSTSSRLFLNVRERLSLCYYASSGLEKRKGLLTVSSGIENENVDVAREEILRQLADMQAGNVTQEELESARRTILNALEAMKDSPANLQEFWLGQALSGLTWDIGELAERVREVSREDIVAAAERVALDTVYFLKGVGV